MSTTDHLVDSNNTWSLLTLIKQISSGLFNNVTLNYTLTNYTATCLPSRKLYKLNEPYTQDTAGEAKTSS